MTDVAPRSSFVASVRNLAQDRAATTIAPTDGSSRGNSRGARRLRRARAAPGA
jgi:hypothetical protein